MGRIFVLLYCILSFTTVRAQENYAEAMQMGTEAFKKGEYKRAIDLYFAAEAFDPGKKTVVKDSVKSVFNAIELLRAKADKLVNAFYFYADRFALAYKNERYYFIDKNGDKVEKLGKWEFAEQFEITGFAKVTDNNINYLIDTSNGKYKVTYESKDVDERIMAAELTLEGSETLPANFFKNKNLQILFLTDSHLKKLPKDIAALSNLFYLDLRSNELTVIPKEIGELKNLTFLNLNSNPLMGLPDEISKLTKLTTLNLRGTKLKKLPPVIWKLENLTTLNLNSIDLDSLPKEISKLKNLTTLYLRNNALTSLPAEIGELKKLAYLVLDGNPICENDAEIAKIIALLPANCVIAHAKPTKH